MPRPTAFERPMLKKCHVCDHAPDCRPMRPIPSIDTLYRWEAERGMCKTPAGKWTEPDGHDEWGCPSWMLVLHLI